MSDASILVIVSSFLGTILAVLGWITSKILVTLMDLNSKLAVVVEQITHHDNRISKLEAKHA